MKIAGTTIIMAGSVILLFTLVTAVSAADYTVTTPLPGLGVGEQLSGQNIFGDYVSSIIPFLLAFATIAATVMIVIGGILYASSLGNPTTMGSAKDMISSAIIGLLLALLSVLILRTINPDLVNLSINIPELNI
jgi:hypothetical protein